jgi:hypothetical protein
MKSARDGRECALALLEVGDEAPGHTGRVAVAETWLRLAILQDSLSLWMDEVERVISVR